MGYLIAIAIILLISVIVVQIGRFTDLAAEIRGEERAAMDNNRLQSRLLLAFMVVFLIACFWSAYYYKNLMLGYGPHSAASAHGGSLDQMFDITLILTGIVFVITQIVLFWYTYKYRAKKGAIGYFMPHDNTLEIVWTIIPALAMTVLVIKGLNTWNTVMADITEGEDYIELEAMGMQFNWNLRYPGEDGVLGETYYKNIIDGVNPLGQVWEDKANWDDFHPDKIVLPVNKKVRVKIVARDVLHNFYLPHFRLKMDAVPGMPTYFVFTPITTTEEYRQELREYPEYQKTDEDGVPLWENFNYELACAELCGIGHWSMRRIVEVVSEEEYEAWLTEQKSFYMTQVRNTEYDPFKGQELDQ